MDEGANMYQNKKEKQYGIANSENENFCLITYYNILIFALYVDFE